MPERRQPRPEPAARGALVCERDAEPFERLRDRSDAFLAAYGSRPQIFVSSLAPDAATSGRRDFARGVFEAGGFEVAGGGAFDDLDALAQACVDSGALAVCLCPSEAAYAGRLGQAAPAANGAPAESLVEAAARRLGASGVRVVIAGWPGDFEAALRRRGVEDFLFKGSDVISFLQRVWDRKARR